MLAAMYFFLRGTPFIYQGQELGMVNFERQFPDMFNDISSIDQYRRSLEEGLNPDEALRIVNLRSRDNARTPFPWDGSRYGGFSQSRPWLPMTREYPVIHAEAQSGAQGSVLEFYKAMIQFRQQGPYRDCLIYGSIQPIESSKDVIAYERQKDGVTIWCYYNFSNTGTMERLPDHAEGAVGIWGNDAAADIRGGMLCLKPFQAILLKPDAARN